MNTTDRVIIAFSAFTSLSALFCAIVPVINGTWDLLQWQLTAAGYALATLVIVYRSAPRTQ